MSQNLFSIRAAVPSDCKDIRSMIQELADYEKMSDGPKISGNDLIEDGFGNEKFFNCVVAEWNEHCNKGEHPKIVGYALYFFTYSTWEGRCIYMEDIYVKEQFRGHGIGSSLLKTVSQEGIRKGCRRLEFSVLDWNKPSIDFYASKGAVNLTTSEGWNKFRMNEKQMLDLCQNEKCHVI